MTSQGHCRNGQNRRVRHVRIDSIDRTDLDVILPSVTKPGDPEQGTGSNMTA